MHAFPQTRASTSGAAAAGTGTGIGAAAAERDTTCDSKYWDARHGDGPNSLQMTVRLMMVFEYIYNDRVRGSSKMELVWGKDNKENPLWTADDIAGIYVHVRAGRGVRRNLKYKPKAGYGRMKGTMLLGSSFLGY